MQKVFINRAMFILSVVATFALLSNMVLIPLFRYDILVDTASFSLLEVILLFSFLLIFLFNTFCFVWGCRQSKSKSDSILSTFVLMASVLCIVMLFGQKTMIDEIARHYRFKWESNSEWIMLYFFYTLQLVFNIVIFVKVKGSLKEAGINHL